MSILTPENCERVYQNALTVLETVGIAIDDQPVLDLLLKKGAKAGSSSNHLLLPQGLVKDRLQCCPDTIKIGSRNGSLHTLGSQGGTVFWTGNALHVAEGRTNRELLSDDLARLTRVAEACPNVDGMVGTSIADYPAPARDFAGFQVMAHNTRKHLRPCIFTPTGATAILEEAEVLLGGQSIADNPIVSFGYSVVSPLHWSATGIGVLRNTSGKKIPFMINSEPMAGGTAPVTLAGCLVSGTAEVLSGIVISQILEEGRPIVFNLGFAHIMDMTTAMALTGAPENALLQAAGADLSRHFNLPSASWMSTEAMLVDGQAAFEKTLTGMAHTDNGVNIIWGIGNLEGTISMSAEMLVIDDEIVGALRHFKEGIVVNDENLALESIQEVGLQGDFLSTDHTFDHFRETIRHTRLLTRSKRAVWEETGRRTLEEKAAEQVEAILATPCPELVEPEQSREIEKIVQRYLEIVKDS